MARYSANLTDQYGRPIGGALVYVVVSSTGALAVLTNDDTSSLNNPFKTNDTGAVVFNSDADFYDISYWYGGRLIRQDFSVNVGGASSLPSGSVVNSLSPGATNLAPSQNAVQTALNLKADSSALSASGGSNLIGFIQSGTGAVARTILAKAREVFSLGDFGAVGDGTTDNTSIINAAIAAAPANSRITVPGGGRFLVTSLTNARNVGFDGGGQIVIGSGNAAYALNDYPRTKGFIVGAEYLFRLYQRIGTIGTTLNGFMFGDSTVARGNTTVQGSISGTTMTVTNVGTATLAPGTFITSVAGSPQIVSQLTGTPFGNGTYQISASATVGAGTISIGNGGGFAGDTGEPQVMIPKLFKDRGVRNAITMTNLAIGGTNWSQANPVPYLSTTTDIIFLKYAINHVSGQNIQSEISAMRTVLANVRANTNGSVSKLSIVLLGPSSTFDQTGGRTSAWYEQLRIAYEQAARDYQCCYIDLYGLFQDSTWWAGFYADTPAVHPNGFLQQQIWAQIANALLPRGATQLSTGDDWVNLGFSNSWTHYGAGFDPASATLSEDGWVHLRGAIARSSGTPTAGQTMATLPNSNYYPTASQAIIAQTFDGSAWTSTPLNVAVDGTISPRDTSAKNTFVSLANMSWRVF